MPNVWKLWWEKYSSELRCKFPPGRLLNMRISLMGQFYRDLKYLGYDYFCSKLKVWKILRAEQTDFKQKTALLLSGHSLCKDIKCKVPWYGRNCAVKGFFRWDKNNRYGIRASYFTVRLLQLYLFHVFRTPLHQTFCCHLCAKTL